MSYGEVNFCAVEGAQSAPRCHSGERGIAHALSRLCSVGGRAIEATLCAVHGGGLRERRG